MPRVCLAPWLALAACATSAPVKKQVLFADSPLFTGVKSQSYGLLQRDFNGDGLGDAVVAVRGEGGFRLQTYVGQKEGEPFRPGCDGPLVAGEELDIWTFLSDGPLLTMSATTETPDEVQVSWAVADLSTGCATMAEDTTVLRRPAHEVLTPPGFWMGARVDDAGQLIVVDAPRFVKWPERDALVLTSVRLRAFVPKKKLYEETRVSLGHKVENRWQWEPLP